MWDFFKRLFTSRSEILSCFDKPTAEQESVEIPSSERIRITGVKIKGGKGNGLTISGDGISVNGVTIKAKGSVSIEGDENSITIIGKEVEVINNSNENVQVKLVKPIE